MKRSRTSAAIAIAIATSFTMGCSTIEVVDVQQLDTNSHKSKEFIIINNDDVWRNDFVMMTFNEWAIENGYTWNIQEPHSGDYVGQYVLDYTVGWHWDWTPYINDIKIILSKDGERIGYTNFDGQGLLNPNKWQSDAGKLRLTLDSVFAEKTVEQVNELL